MLVNHKLDDGILLVCPHNSVTHLNTWVKRGTIMVDKYLP